MKPRNGRSDIGSLLASLRPEQWVKNFILFLPLVFGRKLFVQTALVDTLAGFFLFSLTTSVSYLINDIIDFERDKIHPVKSSRPIASGRVTVKRAKVLALCIAVLCLPAAFLLNRYFGLMMLGYAVFNVVYSKILKRVVIIDVFCIGLFFFLRVIAGSVLSGVKLSHWIVFMVIILALFLGFTKRRQELAILEAKAASHRDVLERYDAYFLDQIIAVLTSSVVIFYTLYTVDARTIGEFGTSHLVFTIPFVYYGIFRYLYLIHKQCTQDDPTGILLSDRPMQINLALWILVCIAVVYFGF